MKRKKIFFLIFLVLTILISSFVSADLSGSKELIQYGDMWLHLDVGQTIVLPGSMVYVNLNFSNSTIVKGFELNLDEDVLTVLKPGHYKVDYSISFSGGANSEFGGSIGINGLETNSTHSHRKIGTGGDVGNMGATGLLLNLSTNDNISVMIRDEASPTSNPAILAANIVLIRIDTEEQFTSEENFLWLYSFLIGVGIILLLISKRIEEVWFEVLGGFLFIIAGIVMIIFGYPGFTDLFLQRGMGIIITGVGLYYSIFPLINYMEEKFK